MAAKNRWNKVLGVGLVTAGAVGVYTLALKPWLMRLGSSADERERPLPGDELVPRPMWGFNHAVTIHAPADEIWPWLVQWGYGRGGFYSYDWIDRLLGASGVKSAERILPEHQQIEAGQIIPVEPGGMGFLTAEVQPGRAIVLLNRIDLKTLKPYGAGDPTPAEYANLSWAWVLDPLDEERTRLISRCRADMRFAGSPLNVYMGEPLQPGSAFMDWGMLQGIKRRVEAARWGVNDQ